MKKILTFLIVLYGGYLSSQEGFDAGTPTNSLFHLGGDIQGTIQNSVNEVTGKVTFSTPLASIAAGSVSYGVNLTYNGEVAFKNGQQTNKYNSTSAVGVGWSMGVPKIVVDNKNTGTRDDDEFYLLDGTTNTKLICIDRGSTINGSAWEFQMEKYAPWKIYFYYHTTWGDYWKIVKDNGLTYYFGNQYVKDGKEFVVRYGNWIGSSKQSGATSEQTIVWNITKIEDQWNNNITFTYDMVKQTMSGKDQTEAAYLSNVWSSNGAHVQLAYGNKNSDEYYEPHQEASEPDAYQERYEKKYLQSVSSYNNENQLVSIYNIGYTLNGSGLNKKRYLTSLTQTAYNNGLNQTLPTQTFEYHYTGVFKGGLKKIAYPTGGSVTYNYNNKFLFSNTVNKFAPNLIWPTGYDVHSRVVKNNYTLYLLRSTNPITGNKYRFKFFRLWWNGESWEHNEFTFPHLIDDHISERLKDFHAVLENDFYGFVYDKGTTADMYLFHQKSDGRTWHEYTSTNRTINDNPYFMSGNGFVGLGSRDNGNLYAYVWNGSSWNYKLINQGSGEYFMAATNNFILSLDERDGSNGVDMITGLTHSDYYYIHYLDAEKNWQTKSWSAAADPYINDVWITNNSPGNASFYPSNSISGFVAKDNPELFLRWDTNFNLTNVDNDVLGSYNDLYPIQPIANSMFTLHHHISNRVYISARFNGVNWKVINPTAPSYGSAYLQFGLDLFSYRNSLRANNNPSTSDCKIYNYDPNINSWANTILYAPNNLYNNAYNPINSEFMVIGSKFFNKSNQGTNPLFNEIGSLNNNNVFAYSDGLSHTFVQENFNNGRFYYTDKKDGLLKYIQQYQVFDRYMNLSKKLGGSRPFMSPTTLCLVETAQTSMLQLLDVYLYKIINDKMSNSILEINSVYDIVVNQIDINDDNGSLRKVQYTYNNPMCTPDNTSTFYGEVVIENKGAGSGNLGKVVKLFNNGSTDLTLAGLLQEVQIRDASDNILIKTSTSWYKSIKPVYGGGGQIDESYYLKLTSEKEEHFFNTESIVSETTHLYNAYGQKTSSLTTNSKGEYIKEEIKYAHQQYLFVKDKNMLSSPYQKIRIINNEVVNINQSKWVSVNGKVYINENWSGPSFSELRLSDQITTVESTTGNVLETSNGKGLYNSALFGYDNLRQVVTVSNASYQDVINQLDVTYAQLQNLNTVSLKIELMKLYNRLPNAMISLSFYDDNGRIINTVNNRKEESYAYYDIQGKLDYITDSYGNILKKEEYNFGD